MRHKHFSEHDQAVLRDFLPVLEHMTEYTDLGAWKRHALRAAWMAIDAVCRGDVTGIHHAESATNRAIETIGLNEAAHIVYGYIPRHGKEQ